MKRIAAACVIFVLLIAGCGGAYRLIDRTTARLADEVTRAHDALGGDAGSAAQMLETSYGSWRRAHELLSALVRHDEIDEIENLYLRALQCAEDGAVEEGRMQTRELAGMLRHLAEMERPTGGNIL